MTSQQLVSDFDSGKIDDQQLQEAAFDLGWDEADYYDLCDEEDGVWYPTDGSDYSIVDHCLDYLKTLTGE